MDKMWAKQAVDKMGNWRALYDPSNLKNTYEAKFGGGMAGDINPFASMPKTEDEAMAKLKNNMWKLKGYEIANAEFMTKLIKDMNITSFAPGQEPWNKGQ
jgi:succinate dehydrogenase/fumarate reductase flavoprotein subunit